MVASILMPYLYELNLSWHFHMHTAQRTVQDLLVRLLILVLLIEP